MKKLESSLKNMVVVLVLVALITGGLLAYVNHVTAASIKAQAEKTLADGIKTVMGNEPIKIVSNDTVRKSFAGKECTFVIHRINDDKGTAMGAAIESSAQGFGGKLNVLVGFNPDGKILGYTILQSTETPGLGQKASSWFQKEGKGNIIGMNPAQNKMTVKKDGGEVDAITAATITSRSFLEAVNQAYKAYKDGTTQATKTNH